MYVELGFLVAEHVHPGAPVDLQYEGVSQLLKLNVFDTIPHAIELIQETRADTLPNIAPNRMLICELGDEGRSVVQHEPEQFFIECLRAFQVQGSAKDSLETAG